MIITVQFVALFAIALVLTLISLLLDISLQRYNLKALRFLIALILTAVIIWLCVLNFAAALTLLVVATGIIGLIDQLFFYRKRKAAGQTPPLVVENARSFFWALLLVWVIRSFIIQPYRVPTGSLQPTVKPGDFLVVNQFAYGLRFPVLNSTLVDVGEPKRGDLVLFYAPLILRSYLLNGSLDYQVIGWLIGINNYILTANL